MFPRPPLLARCSLGFAVLSCLTTAAQAQPREPDCSPAAPTSALTPHGTAVLAGQRTSYRPFATLELGQRCMTLSVPASLAGRIESVSSFAADRDGNEFAPSTTYAPELRAGLRFDSGKAWLPVLVLAEYEQDVLTGFTPEDSSLDGEGLPYSDELGTEVRKAYARIAFAQAVQLGVGLQTSHWGLGLLANDGAHGWEPGSGRFSDPRSGDRVLRAQLSTGPHSSLGLTAAIGVDSVVGDDVVLEGDEAQQAYVAVLLGYGKPTSAGAYVVRRHQENTAGRATDVSVFDVTAQTTLSFSDASLSLATEWALITGTTELAPSSDFQQHDVLQLGGALRGELDLGAFGSIIDLLYASGDRNLDDADQNAFKVDPNYEFGLLLFRQVLAAHSGRGAVTPADPNLLGVPADDLERIPTRGSPSNTLAFFPKLRYRPIDGLEAYGGPLFAFAAVENADPFNTRINGGVPSSALGGTSGRYLGTEYDLGIRYRALLGGSELTLGVEGGAFKPGSALRHLDGNAMGAVYGGRAMLRYRL